MGPARLVEVVVGHEGAPGLDRLGALAVGRDVEAGPHQLGEQLRAPAAPVEDDGGPGVGADGGPDLGGHPASSPTSDAPGSSHHISTPSPRASAGQVSDAAGMARRMRARWALAPSAQPW